jgi:hypothetical protein
MRAGQTGDVAELGGSVDHGEYAAGEAWLRA